MNASLAKAVSAIEALPESDQQEAAEGLLAWVELVRSEPRPLTEAQIAGVEAARAEARADRFASDDEMDDVWRKFDQ